jgi:hypothetical protein
MPAADWAYAPTAPAGSTGSTGSTGSNGSTVLDELRAAVTADMRTDLLLLWGAFVQSLDDRSCYAATADNVVRADGGLTVAAPLLDTVTPLDRGASHARVAWHLAWALVQAGELGDEAPDRPVDEHAISLGNRAGLGVTLRDVERFRSHEAASHAATRGFDADLLERDLRAVGAVTPRRFAAAELLDARSCAAALVRAYDELTAARRDRDAAEALAVDAAANRALAQSLGEELERDEWIRARLRAVKATRPARALIEARKRLLGRSE